jgi:hypothetical protein
MRLEMPHDPNDSQIIHIVGDGDSLRRGLDFADLVRMAELLKLRAP